MSIPRARVRQRRPGSMNGLEAAYSLVLETRRLGGEVSAWRFEPCQLRIGSDWKTTYRPDFMVILPDGLIEFHETKGFRRDDAMVKLKVAAAEYPEFAFRLVEKKGVRWQTTEVE